MREVVNSLKLGFYSKLRIVTETIDLTKLKSESCDSLRRNVQCKLFLTGFKQGGGNQFLEIF